MSKKVVEIPGLGSVLLTKRRNNRNLRLSVSGQGMVRVSMPYWAPYSTGIAFVKSRSQWVRQQVEQNSLPLIKDGVRIGNRLTVRINQSKSAAFTSQTTDDVLVINLPEPHELEYWQNSIRRSVEKALKKEAEKVLPGRLKFLADEYGYKFRAVRIRKMSSRWGSCSGNKVVTLSYYLVQLPETLVDYVLVHELLHTKHMHHGPDFWADFEKIVPGAKSVRRQMRAYRPSLAIEI